MANTKLIIEDDYDDFYNLNDKFRIKEDLDIWMIPNFDNYLGFDAKQIQTELENNYPVRGEGDKIKWGECQWVEGDNDALKYRGNVLKRGKMWLQKKNPKTHGFVKYYYTGWQYNVLPATSCIDNCKELIDVWKNYDTWCVLNNYSQANHLIVTHYKDETHSIGRHYDKPQSIKPNSLITIIKTGECGRRFYLANRDDPDNPIFNSIVEPGTAIIMTLEANLQTIHAVPQMEKCGNSGSIVLRTITEVVEWEALEKKINK